MGGEGCIMKEDYSCQVWVEQVGVGSQKGP